MTTSTASESTATRNVDWSNPRVASILQAAARCFARSGFAATTLAEIGRELGLRKSIVHYYFDSKAALIHEVQAYSYQRYLEEMRSAVATSAGDSRHRAASALRAVWAHIRGDDASTALHMEVWSAARRDPELQRRSATLAADARRLVGEGLAEAGAAPQGAEPLATLVIATLNGLALARMVEGENARSDEAFELFLDLLGRAATAAEPGA